MKKLTLLIDADDVCVDLDGAWVAALNKKYGTTVSPEDVTDWEITKTFPTLSKAQVFGVLKEHDLWAGLMPIPGSQKYLNKLHEEKHDIYIATATDFDTCGTKVRRFMELYPFLTPERFIIAHNKQLIRGDVLVDNYPGNLINGNYLRILFDRPHNRNFQEKEHGMFRATTWEEVYLYIHRSFAHKHR